ncbi:oxygen-independent coproporphyrinogen-3 oxidase [Ruminiclostridium sufflavum DSM 19573]|uniref:Heme chaperone HemW n=1 Tax=Ruminiclostridium sufflavum DSM 19573 TaxID=1121337 RepID=A0A318XNY2_9FIRM|nr:radical SAM family heme chaperone HemW [Ruminiclostridium sufflavum]PYG89865.1 oxygen-independent coproporphyrinogen-3 oxidase [Ruminiclostridium sufflavum DSM 19573]
MSPMTRTGLYIHVPFCSSKCNYCDFNSYAGKLHLAEKYFSAVQKEIQLYYNTMKYNLIDSIYIGGGTPSCIKHKYICEILDMCRINFNIAEDCEISIESNPGTLDIEKLTAYRSSGINRISIGLQAYRRSLLKYLGRRHSAEDFISSVELAKKAGFCNINADIIFGIPGQTFEDWTETLRVLVELGVKHISAYSLKIEEGTKFGDMLENGELIPVEDELDREMYHYAVNYFKKNGFKQYEISNFSKEGYICRHNLIYWKCADYLGLGAGAHSLLDGERFSNKCSIESYTGDLERGVKPVEERYRLEYSDRMSEYMFLGLRLNQGVNNTEFKELFKKDMFFLYKESFEELQKNKLIEIQGQNVRLTGLGLDLANQVFVKFV